MAALIPVAAIVAVARVVADRMFSNPAGRLSMLLLAAVPSACLGALQLRDVPFSPSTSEERCCEN
jgi:hypothetical protein